MTIRGIDFEYLDAYLDALEQIRDHVVRRQK
jgi:hypothetical protein